MTIVTGWGNQSIHHNGTTLWHCGPLQLYYKVAHDELWLAYHPTDAEQPEQALQPVAEATLKWQRWSLKKAADSIKILPTFPDLPVIIKPETSFWMTPGVKTRVYPRIPLWIKVLLEGEALLETPVLPISKTWFGDFLDGEICYWIKSFVRKEILPEQHRPFLAVSPIQIVNRSDEELLVDKICHRVDQLSIFEYENQLWSNETRIRYRGQNDVSEIDVMRKAPPEAVKAKLLSEPRVPHSNSITAKTFASLKELPGFGFLRG